MYLLLSRHGNTFEDHDTPVMAGSKNDLMLVEKGIQQAKTFGAYLKKQKINPAAIYAGNLKRTKEYAKIAAVEAKLSAIVQAHEVLTEIDYGDWTGLSSDQIVQKFGKASFDAWEHASVWPQNANWQGSAAKIMSNIKTFADMLTKSYHASETVMCVSSNGILRYFLTLAPGAFEQAIVDGTVKVKTGNICGLKYKDGTWTLDFWNQNPAEMK